MVRPTSRASREFHLEHLFIDLRASLQDFAQYLVAKWQCNIEMFLVIHFRQ